MDNLPDGFEIESTPQSSGIPEGFEIEDPSQPQVEDISNIPEIGEAPELGLFEDLGKSFKASYGLLAAGDDEDASKILKTQFPNAKVRKSGDSTIVTLDSGEYVINKPGVSGQDLARFLFGATAFTPAGGARSMGGAIGANALTETAIDAGAGALGGEGVNVEDTVQAGLLGGAFKGLENVIGAGYRC